MDFGDYILEKADMDNNVDNTGGNKDLAENGIVVTEAMIETVISFLNGRGLLSDRNTAECFLDELFSSNP